MLQTQVKYLILFLLLFACESEKLRDRSQQSRPTDETEENPGYLDSIEKDVLADSGGTVAIGNTTVNFPEGAADSDFRVRLSRSATTPKLSDTESAVLGDPAGEIMTIEVYDPKTNVILSSDDLKSPYEFKQTFTTSSATDKIGLMVVTDGGTASEQRILLPNSELSITKGAGLHLSDSEEVTVRVSLKITNAVLWLVPYTEDALKFLTIGTAQSVTSIGGTTTQTVIITPTSSITRTSISINSGAAYTNSAAVTLSIAATGASEMYVTNTSGCSEGGTWEIFSASKSWTLTSLNSVSRVYVKFRAADGAASSCLSGSVIHDDIAPNPPSSVNDGSTHQSLTISPTLSWGAGSDAGSGVARYEIAIGSSAGGSNIKNWTAVGTSTSTQITGLSLTTNNTYYPSVRAVDAAGNESSVAEGDGWTATNPLNCPSGYIAIPANGDLGTGEFCVMKYEAKDVSGVATSQPSGTPWVSIVRGTDGTTANSAWKACKDLNTTNPVSGMTFDLITNAQWQAIARNIETAQSAPGIYRNWSNGSTSGANALNRGHSDGAPSSALAADTIDNPDDDPCIGTGQTDCSNQTVNLAVPAEVATYSQKRTHTLSNGEVIWDIAGNVWEWVQEGYTNQGIDNYVSQLTSANGYNMLRWGPAGDFTAKSSGEYGGLGYGYLSGSGGAVLRGGHWGNFYTGAGVFAANLNDAPTDTNYDVGFRCSAVGGL